MEYSKSREIIAALNFEVLVDGIQYQIKPEVRPRAALDFGYVVLTQGFRGTFDHSFISGSISLNDDVSAIQAIITSRIRAEVLDQLTPRDCVISVAWEELITIASTLREAGQTAMAEKICSAYFAAGASHG